MDNTTRKTEELYTSGYLDLAIKQKRLWRILLWRILLCSKPPKIFETPKKNTQFKANIIVFRNITPGNRKSIEIKNLPPPTF